MGLEAATHVSDFVVTNPAGGDDTSQGDDHIRMAKAVLKTTFPGATKAFRFPVTAAEATGTVTVTFPTDQNKLFPVSAAGAARAVNLPDCTAGGTVNEDGFMITVIKTDSSANAVTIDASGAQLINGETTLRLTRQWEGVFLVWAKADAEWYVFPCLLQTTTTTEVNDWSIVGAIAGEKPTISVQGSDTDIIGRIAGKGTGGIEIEGTATDDDAVAGDRGEYIEEVVAIGAAVALVDGVAKTVVSKLFAAGDYLVGGKVAFTGAGTTIQTSNVVGLSEVADTLPSISDPSFVNAYTNQGPGNFSFIASGSRRIKLASATTIHLINTSSFSAGALSAYGTLWAWRMR